MVESNVKQVGDRRPIATRDRQWSRTAAHWLSQRRVSANGISAAGMACGIGGGVALALTDVWSNDVAVRALWLAGAVMVQLRLIANMLDGMVAIESATASPVGELYNEVPDRISDAAILIGLGYAHGGHVTLGYVAACMAIFVAYVRAQAKVAGAPQDFCGPMAKPHRMFVVTVAAVYCALTPSTWQPLMREQWSIAAGALAIVIAGSLLTVVRRLARAARFLHGGSA